LVGCSITTVVIGVNVLEVVESSPTRVILTGWMGLDELMEGAIGQLVEVTFDFDEDSRSLNRVVVRAGELWRRDDPTWDVPFQDLSARARASRIARRPEDDSDWASVICVPSS
jgi:hypothetical protein